MNEVYSRIKDICLNTNDNDPIGIARKIMHDDLIKMHGPEHHFIDGASLLPLDIIDIDSISQIVSEKDTPIIVYCRSGNRSKQAREKLIALGYSKVYDLGAMSNWKE